MVLRTDDIVDFQQHAKSASQLLKIMSNENRLMILCFLGVNELSVSEINAQIPLSQSALSQHLAVLRNEGLVSTRRDSQTIYYSVAKGPSLKIIETLKTIYCPS